MTKWWIVASLGFEMAAAVFVGAGLGYWADKSFKSEPWGMVTGIILGALAGFWNLYKLMVKDDRT